MRFCLSFLLFVASISAVRLPAQSLSGGHTISGFVREEGSNTPITAVELEISSSGSRVRPSVTSGTEGEFVFKGLPDGEYSIVASKTGYETTTVTVTVMRAGSPQVSIPLRRSTPEKLVSPGDSISVRELTVPERARAAYDRGRRLLEDENKPAESIPEFQQAAKAYPQYYEAYTEIGIANYHLGKFPEAEQALTKAIDTSSGKFVQPLYLLADLYNGQRKFQEAETLARQAIALDDYTWNSHFELARALVGLKKGTDAETSALRARTLAPGNAPVQLVLANAHLLEQKFAAAIEDFDAYLRLEPTGPLSQTVRQRRDQLQKQLQQPPVATPRQP